MNHRQLQINDVEPLHTEIVSFIEAAQNRLASPVSGIEGRNALALALRVLSLVEWAVRERLRQEGSSLQEIYAGQPGRKTTRPSAALLLRAMTAISVSVVAINGQTHAMLSPLTAVQQRLLELWSLPPDLYEKVARGFPIPPSNTSEP